MKGVSEDAGGGAADLVPAADAGGAEGGAPVDAAPSPDGALTDGGLTDLRCEGPRDLPLVTGLRVTVTNGPGGAKICDAKVTAKGAHGTIDLSPYNCLYVGPGEGMYLVEATRAGFKTGSKTVSVPLGSDCHPVPQYVTIELVPM